MSIERLLEIVPPPELRNYTGTQTAWPEIENNIGTQLPHDYKKLIEYYGLGYFGGYICPLNPFLNPPGYLHLIASGRDVLEGYQEGQQKAPNYHPPFNVFPTDGGLLPWGRDDNAGIQCWLTQGPPDEWTVVVMDSHYSQNYAQFSTSMTDFLAEWLVGNFTVDFFPSDVYPMEKPLFQMFRPPWIS